MQENLNLHIVKSSELAGKCQRNWADEPVDEFDLRTIIDSAMNMPTKQNVKMYELVVVQDKKAREFLYDSSGVPEFEITDSTRWRNGQMLAPTVFMWFISTNIPEFHDDEGHDTSTQHRDLINLNTGISMGAAALTATQLGYNVGFNCCGDNELYGQLGRTVNNDFNDYSFICALGIGKPMKEFSRNIVPKNKNLNIDLTVATEEHKKEKTIYYI